MYFIFGYPIPFVFLITDKMCIDGIICKELWWKGRLFVITKLKDKVLPFLPLQRDACQAR